MKRHNDQPIHEVLSKLMKSPSYKNGFYDTKIKQIWENKLGKLLLNKTEKIHFSKGTIYLKLNSAPLRQQLMMGKDKLIKNFNNELGDSIVNNIILT